MAKCDRRILASKALDLLLWKSIRVSNFEQKDKDFYLRVRDRIDMCLEGVDLTPSYYHLVTHYTSCLLSVQFAHWGIEPEKYSYWKSVNESEVALDSFEFDRGDSDYNIAFSVILKWAEKRLINLDVRIVYETFLEVVQDIKQRHVEIPESVHLDFVTSIYLVAADFAYLEFLTTMIREPICYIELPKKKLSGIWDNDDSVLIRLLLIEEFNHLASLILHITLSFNWEVIEADGDVIPNSDFMPLFKYKFKNPIAQGVLCDVLNGVEISIPMLSIVDKQIDSLNDEIKLNTDEFDEIIYKSLHFCFSQYKFNLFGDDEGNPIRIDKLVNICAGYCVKIFYNIADEAEEKGLYRKAKYVQELDSANAKISDANVEKLPTVCSFLNRYLFNAHGINIPAKRLWLTHKAIEKERIEDGVNHQWHEASLNRKRYSEEWFETQIQMNFLPKYQRKPQHEEESKVTKPKKSSNEQLLLSWGQDR